MSGHYKLRSHFCKQDNSDDEPYFHEPRNLLYEHP